jgi:hypothetical protein
MSGESAQVSVPDAKLDATFHANMDVLQRTAKRKRIIFFIIIRIKLINIVH